MASLNFEKKVEGIGFLSFCDSGLDKRFIGAHVAQLVEHVLGKDEVISSILIMGSIKITQTSNERKQLNAGE